MKAKEEKKQRRGKTMIRLFLTFEIVFNFFSFTFGFLRTRIKTHCSEEIDKREERERMFDFDIYKLLRLDLENRRKDKEIDRE